jgi:hypothetical protein
LNSAEETKKSKTYSTRQYTQKSEVGRLSSMQDDEVAMITPPASDQDYKEKHTHPMLGLAETEKAKRPKTRGRGVTLSEAMPDIESG